MTEELRRYAALHHHLLYNHFPPIAAEFIGPAQEAIDAATVGDWDRVIKGPRGGTATVAGIVEALHLSDFIPEGIE